MPHVATTTGTATEKLKRFLREGGKPAYDSPPIERIPCISVHGIKLIDVAEVDYVPAFPITPQTEIIEQLSEWCGME